MTMSKLKTKPKTTPALKPSHQCAQGRSAQASAELSPPHGDAVPPTNTGEAVPQNTLLQTSQSVLWAMLGVQNKRNAKRDFSQGKVSHFVFLGLLFALFFVLGLVLIVRSVLPEV